MVETMGKIDDHYAQQQTQEEKDLGDRLTAYNRMGVIANEVLGAIVRQVRAGNLPKDCEWVYDNGRKVAAWHLYTDYDTDYKFFLLVEEGRLVRTDRGR